MEVSRQLVRTHKRSAKKTDDDGGKRKRQKEERKRRAEEEDQAMAGLEEYLRGIFSNRHPNLGNREKMKVDLGII